MAVMREYGEKLASSLVSLVILWLIYIPLRNIPIISEYAKQILIVATIIILSLTIIDVHTMNEGAGKKDIGKVMASIGAVEIGELVLDTPNIKSTWHERVIHEIIAKKYLILEENDDSGEIDGRRRRKTY